LGRAYENLMIDLAVTNEKLRARRLRILAGESGKSVSEAEQALRLAGHEMRVALVMLKRGMGTGGAKRLLAKVHGDLRMALGE